MTLFDLRQSILRGIAQWLSPYTTNPTADQLMISTNLALTPPLKADATSIPSMTVNIGAITVPNSVSNRTISASFINEVIPVFSGGTVVFPGVSGGNIVPSTGGSTILTLSSGNYVPVLLSLDSLGLLHAQVGTQASTAATTVLPIPTANYLPFAYVMMHNIGGVIQNVTQNTIVQLVANTSIPSSSANSAPWIAEQVSLPISTTSFAVIFATPQPDTSYVVLHTMENDTDSNPQFQQIEVTSKTNLGFTFTWNVPLNSSNYFIDYIIPPVSSPGTEYPISSGVNSVTATLNIPQNGVNYGIVGFVQNIVNPIPQFQTAIVTNQASTNFTDYINANTADSNSTLVYISNPTAQIPATVSSSSVTVTLPVPYGSVGYAVVASMSNITDPNPKVQPLLITAKSFSQFTISFNTAIPTGNYLLTYYAIRLTA